MTAADSYPDPVRAANTLSEPRWQLALAAALAGERSVSGVVAAILDQAVYLTRSRGGLVLLRELRSGALHLAAERGPARRLLDGREKLAGESLHPLVELAARGQLAIVGWRELHQHWPSPADADRYAGLGTLAVLPLTVDGEVLALLALVFAGEVQVDPALAARLEALSTLGANALDRAQLAEAARAAADAKAAFLAMMSHELRTPLNAIMGYTSLLADEVVGELNEVQRDHLGRVQDRARHLLTLIEELLSLTSAEGGSAESTFERIEPVALVESVLPLVTGIAARRGLRLGWRPLDDGTTFLSDADKLRQILSHLVTNALNFTERGGITVQVSVSGAGAGRMVEFTVMDTGPGIPSVDQERIFEPFWQASRSHSRRSSGTGLGLHVARRMARLLGGDITVESHVGEGSSFTLRVPAPEV